MTQGEGLRIVSKYVEGLLVTFDADGDPKFVIGNQTNASGWVLADATQGVLQWRGFLDLSGYRPDDMVLSPRAVQVQYGANWGATGAGGLVPGGNAFVQYALTTDKIDNIDYGTFGAFESLAGFIGDNTEMDQVIYGCSELWGPAAAGSGSVNQQKMEYGDGVPIVGPRVYIAIRIQLGAPIVSGNATDGTWFIPSMRFVIAGDASEVPEFQLLHLMKRQYDLQQTPDVDL